MQGILGFLVQESKRNNSNSEPDIVWIRNAFSGTVECTELHILGRKIEEVNRKHKVM